MRMRSTKDPAHAKVRSSARTTLPEVRTLHECLGVVEIAPVQLAHEAPAFRHSSPPKLQPAGPSISLLEFLDYLPVRPFRDRLVQQLGMEADPVGYPSLGGGRQAFVAVLDKYPSGVGADGVGLAGDSRTMANRCHDLLCRPRRFSGSKESIQIVGEHRIIKRTSIEFCIKASERPFVGVPSARRKVASLSHAGT